MNIRNNLGRCKCKILNVSNLYLSEVDYVNSLKQTWPLLTFSITFVVNVVKRIKLASPRGAHLNAFRRCPPRSLLNTFYRNYTRVLYGERSEKSQLVEITLTVKVESEILIFLCAVQLCCNRVPVYGGNMPSSGHICKAIQSYRSRWDFIMSV